VLSDAAKGDVRALVIYGDTDPLAVVGRDTLGKGRNNAGLWLDGKQVDVPRLPKMPQQGPATKKPRR